MQGCTERLEKLNPKKLLDALTDIVAQRRLDEVWVRRIVSMLYFALFNYWGAKSYCKRGLRGKGPNQDMFHYTRFHEELAMAGLDRDIYVLYIYRVAADHYVLNPTKVKLYDKVFGGVEEVTLDDDAARKALEAASNILRYLENQ